MQLVYLSPVPWVSFAQRPHKFVECFRRACGGQVLWIDPYPTRLPSWQDFGRKSDGSSSAIEALAGGISVLRPRALPIEPLPWSGAVNRMLWADVFQAVDAMLSTGPTMLGIGKPSELALRLISAGGFTQSFYDAMDDFPAFYHGLSRCSMASRENRVVGGVSKVLVSSTALLSRWEGNNNVLLARNACDPQMLPSIGVIAQQKQRRVIGYIGTIGRWFDWKLVLAIARARPDMQVQLTGPVFGTIPANLPKNIELFPPCTHPAAIAAMQTFTIGLIPFLQNRLTKSVDPIKYYEYRALGLPVISSTFGEMRFHQNDVGVFFLDQTTSLDKVNSTIDAALSHTTGANEIHEFRALNSWERRFASAHLI